MTDDEGPSQALLGILTAAIPAGTPDAGAGPLIAVLVSLVLSALFSGSEAGFLALTRLQALELKEQGHPRAALLLRIIERPADLVSALLIANVTVNVLLAIMWSVLVSQLLAPFAVMDLASIALLQTLAEVLVLTLILVLFAEVTPKAWAHNHPLPFCLAVAPVIAPVIVFTRPAVWLFQRLAQFLLGLFGIRADGPAGVTEDEIIQYLAAGEEAGVIDEEERDLIHSIFQFGDLLAAQVMIPRVSMVSVDESATLAEAMRIAMDNGHSRLPVHAGDRDHITGILHLKDVLRVLPEPGATEMRVADFASLRPAAFVHETKPITELFNEMKAAKNHIIVVVDEYGGTAGLVTIEDLLEELVGDIKDESDIEEPPFRFTHDGALIVDGALPLHDLQDLIAWQAEENGVETVGGLIYSALGRVPEPLEQVDLGGMLAEVLEVEENRIKELRLTGAPLTLEAREILERHFPDALTRLEDSQGFPG